MTIKIVAKQRAFFNGEIIKPGTILNIKGDKIPSWAKRVGSGKTEETKTPPAPPEQNSNGQQTLIPPVEPVSTVEPENNNGDENPPAELDLSGKTEEELNTILDELITKGLEANVYLENTEGKSVVEQIQELSAAIKEAENKGE